MVLWAGRRDLALRECRVCPCFEEVLAWASGSAVVAVDIPVGLLERPVPGGRDCDREARRLLGRGRASSVFTPPVRAALAAKSYAQARRLNGRGLNRQGFLILPKIREVDRVMTPELQGSVHEVHPELSFRAMAGRAMRHPKKTPEGRRERLAALCRALGERRERLEAALRQAVRRHGREGVAMDDVLDALAAAWTAERIARGLARRIPPDPPVDARGLRMEIWY